MPTALPFFTSWVWLPWAASIRQDTAVGWCQHHSMPRCPTEEAPQAIVGKTRGCVKEAGERQPQGTHCTNGRPESRWRKQTLLTHHHPPDWPSVVKGLSGLGGAGSGPAAEFPEISPSVRGGARDQPPDLVGAS